MRFGRFSLTGLLGAALQVLLIELLIKRLRLPAATATAIAVEAVVLHNFVWHERFTWRDCGGSGLRETALRLCQFHFSNGLVSIAGNTLLVHYLVGRGLTPRLAALAAIAACSPLNFLAADRWVYRDSARSVASRFRSCSRERSASARQAPPSTKFVFSSRSHKPDMSGCGVSRMSQGAPSRNA